MPVELSIRMARANSSSSSSSSTTIKPDRIIILAIALAFICVFAYFSLPFLNVIIYALFLYYVSRPIYKFVTGILHGKHRNAASFTAIILCFLPLVLLIIYTAVIAHAELVHYLSSPERAINLPASVMNSSLVSQSKWYRLAQKVGSDGFTSITLYDISQVSTTLHRVLDVALDIIVGIFLAFILTFFMLRDGDKMRDAVIRATPKDYASRMKKFLGDVDAGINAIFFGSIANVIITSLLAVSIYHLLNRIAPSHQLIIPYATLLGVLTGVGNLLPYIGAKLVWVPLLIFLLLNAAAAPVSSAIVIYFVLFLLLVGLLVDLMPEQVLKPFIAGRRVHLGLLIFSYIAGATAFGAIGIFLGPVLLVIGTSFFKNFIMKQ